jgi:glycosyltransferase involved in cell wall biosynthesis
MINNILTLDVLICTINKRIEDLKDFKFIYNKNVNYIISYQCTINKTSNMFDVLKYLNTIKNVQVVEHNSVGLSKNRNLAIKHAKSDICLFCDDDIILRDNFYDIIIEEYNNIDNADLIAFRLNEKENKKLFRKYNNFNEKYKKFTSFTRAQVCSPEITFNRKRFPDLKFNENFGLGSKVTGGEEAILINNMLKMKKNIFHSKKVIGLLNDVTHSGNRRNKEYLYSLGITFTCVHKYFAIVHILKFILGEIIRQRRVIHPLMYLKPILSGHIRCCIDKCKVC